MSPYPPDPAAAARLMNAVLGGPHALEPERAIAGEMLRRWPGIREEVRRAAGWHSLLAAWAVSTCQPAARSLILGNPGYPPSGWDGAALPHLAAARAVPGTACLYCAADEALALLWQRTLSGDSLAMACQASAADPRQVAGMARIAGLEPPWSVQLQLAAHWWTGPRAAAITAGWAAVLPEGSSLVLSVPSPGAVPAGGQMAALAGRAAGVVPSAHSAGDIAGWAAAAGLRLAWGPADVQAWPVHDPARDGHAAGAAGRVLGVVALRP